MILTSSVIDKINDTNTVINTYTDLHVVVEKDVSEFEVSVDDLVLVEVLDAEQDLVHEVPGGKKKEWKRFEFEKIFVLLVPKKVFKRMFHTIQKMVLKVFPQNFPNIRVNF